MMSFTAVPAHTVQDVEFYFSRYPEANPALDGGNDSVLPVHNNGCNNAFYDGHVKWLVKSKVVDPIMWDNP